MANLHKIFVCFIHLVYSVGLLELVEKHSVVGVLFRIEEFVGEVLVGLLASEKAKQKLVDVIAAVILLY